MNMLGITKQLLRSRRYLSFKHLSWFEDDQLPSKSSEDTSVVGRSETLAKIPSCG
jgi:hypothetical protein